jgi:hypothetical protein
MAKIGALAQKEFNAKALAAALLDTPSAAGRPEFADLAAAAYLVRSHPYASVDIVALWPGPLGTFDSSLSAQQNRELAHELAHAILAESAARASRLEAA